MDRRGDAIRRRLRSDRPEPTCSTEIDEDWVRTARAKGLSEKQVLRRHVLRNALISPVNIWGLDFSHAFGGFVLYVEVIFGLPGIGTLTAETLKAYDLPPIVGMAVWLALVVVIFSAIADLVVVLADPRVRRGGRGAAAGSVRQGAERWPIEIRDALDLGSCRCLRCIAARPCVVAG